MNANRKRVEFELGELVEGMPWEIVADYAIDSPDSECSWVKSCVHTFERDHVRLVHLALVALNEAGYNSTALCADCVLEALKRWKERS